jgi:hypothetical protein
MCTISNVKDHAPGKGAPAWVEIIRPQLPGAKSARVGRNPLAWLGRLVGRLLVAATSWVPEGYEDETGFNFGVAPREERSGAAGTPLRVKTK